MFSFIFFVVLLAIDQVTKYLAVTYLQPVNTMPFIPGIMELRFVLNDGAAFSLFAGNRWFLIGFTSLALLLIFLYFIFKKPQNKIEKICLLLIIAGGVGNLIDRILNGVVVDFFATTFINFAVFNVADCYVVVGSILLMLYIIIDEIKVNKLKKENKAEDVKNESI